MESFSAAPAAPPPVVLDVELTIDQNQGLRRSLRANFGLSTRTINQSIDPGMDLIYWCETTLPSSLPCLAPLMHPSVAVVTLRKGHLEWQPGARHALGRSTPTLADLESGTCFLTANNRKVAIASFVNQEVHPAYISIDLLGRPNLLEYLRADTFTLEISGSNYRRLARPLALSALLEFDLRLMPNYAG